MDKTPPTLTGFPADTDVVCRAQPPFVPRYSDELSGVDTESLHDKLDSDDVSADFERSDRYRAKLHAPTSGDFVMSEPAMGYFANGEPQTASGTVSYKLDEGLPGEATLSSVSVNGVACTVTGPDANGNMTFTGQNPCSVSTNFTSATVTVCYTNSTTNVCHTIPLGVWEGYFILEMEEAHEVYPLSDILEEVPPGVGVCGAYPWRTLNSLGVFCPFYSPASINYYSFLLGTACTNRTCVWLPTNLCVDEPSPEFDDIPLTFETGSLQCFGAAQLADRGLTFGFTETRTHQTNGFGTISGDMDRMSFTLTVGDGRLVFSGVVSSYKTPRTASAVSNR